METKPGDLEGLAESSVKALKKDSETAKATVPTPSASTTSVPDPDEDDLDDLDDMLDEFVPPKQESKASTSSNKLTTSTTTQPSIEDDGLSDEDFAKQLQQGMTELLGGLESDPEMASQFEAMMKELTSETGSLPQIPQASSTPTTASSEPAPSLAEKNSRKEDPEEFQETIRKTMERLNASGSSASAAAASSSNNEEDLMAEMLKAMQASGFGGENGEAGGEEDFSKMLLGMMEQLTNKEILYEPMKELHDKFPEWMVKNEGTVKEDDMKRYKEQQIYVKEIVQRFEAKGYSDENVADREYIVERMQKMQAAGSPPPDLVGDMAAAQEAFGAPEEGCPQQ